MDMMGIINMNENEDYLGEITRYRPLAAVPFGGRYRLVDFMLSNMVNSGIDNVGIFIQHKYRSLMDHLRSGKEWDLARKRDGLFILPPAYAKLPMQMHRGDVENFYANIDYIAQSRQKYVVITGANLVCNFDFREVLAYHKRTGAEITIMYCDAENRSQDFSQAHALEVDATGRVTDISEFEPEKGCSKLAMEVIVMEKELLLNLIKECISRGDYDFVKHCIIRNCQRLKIFGFHHPGYFGRIISLQSYFQHSMALLQPAIWRELFFKSGLIYTKVKDEPPSKYTAVGEVMNSLVAGGCHIEGKVENSILFRGVKVHKGAHIKNSIIMQQGVIEGGAVIDGVICDKSVRVSAGKHLKGESSYPLVIKKGRVI